MPEDAIRLSCSRVVQGNYSFYAFVMNSDDLLDIAYVSRRDDEHPDGYQRILKKARLKQIGRYIQGTRAAFPNNIIVNFSDSVRYEPGPSPDNGTLVIPRVTDSAWVIDGQHRLFSFEYAEGRVWPLLVSGFIGLNVNDQAKVFRDVNANQKKVDGSLIYDLIDLVRDADFVDQRAHDIVVALDEDSDSPWRDNIKRFDGSTGIISQTSFITPLKRLLGNEAFKEFSEGEQIDLLKNYFSAWAQLFPDAWLSKKHLLCKSLGVYATLHAFEKVLLHCLFNPSGCTVTSMVDLLTPVRDADFDGMGQLDFSSSQLASFGGQRGQVMLGEMIKSKIPSVQRTGTATGEAPAS